MATNTVLSNYQLQFLNGQVASRYQLYFAVFDPVTITVQSQDIQTDQYGQYNIVPNNDLLAHLVAPYAPQPNLGSNRIGFVNEPLLFDGSRSSQRANLPAFGHRWTYTGSGSLQAFNSSIGQSQFHDASQAAQVQITWTTPGLYTVSLTVQDRFGGTTTGTRQVMIYQDRASVPKGIINLNNLTGSLDNGGWTASITTAIRQAGITLPNSLPVGTYQPILILAETEYEVQPGVWVPIQIGPYGAAVPGQFYDDPRVLFAGYIQSSTAQEDSEKDSVDIQLATVDMILGQAGIHNIGYYHTTYNQRKPDGTPINLNASQVGQGQLVADLTSEDIYRSLLLDHSTVGLFHDVIIWRDFLPDPNASTTRYYLTYSNLTANEGTISDGITTMAQNEYASLWCERNGSICIGPTLNMRGYELFTTPTDYGPQPLGQILNLATELNNNPVKAEQTAYMLFVFGANPLPTAKDGPNSSTRDLSTLVGPPVVAHFSDIPIYDTGAQPSGLFAWTTVNWPQDISLRPMKLSVSLNYTSRSTFVKEVATLVSSSNQNVWSAFYPLTLNGQALFDATGLMMQRVTAGTWTVETTMLLADITATAQKDLSWQYLWEMTRRRYLALNALYTATIDTGMAAWVRLSDVLLITRQKAKDGPQLAAIPFYVDSVTHTLDLDKQTWQTEIVANEITTYNIGPVITPPYPAPVS